MGFESLFMHVFRVREHVLDMIEATAGGRMVFGCVKIGGVRRDIEASVLRGIVRSFRISAPQIRDITNVLLEDYSTRHRMEGVGVLSKEDAYYLGMVGPMIRSCGIPSDTTADRVRGLQTCPIRAGDAQTGDCYARCVVRVKEIFESIDLVRQLVEKTPEGPIDVKVKGTPDGEFFGRIEQPRGEVIYYVKGKRNEVSGTIPGAGPDLREPSGHDPVCSKGPR